MTMRLPVRTPYDGRALAGFLATRAVPGVEVLRGDVYARTMRLPNGHGTVELTLPTDLRCGETTVAHATFSLTDLRDLGAASERTRRFPRCRLRSGGGHLGVGGGRTARANRAQCAGAEGARPCGW